MSALPRRAAVAPRRPLPEGGPRAGSGRALLAAALAVLLLHGLALRTLWSGAPTPAPERAAPALNVVSVRQIPHQIPRQEQAPKQPAAATDPAPVAGAAPARVGAVRAPPPPVPLQAPPQVSFMPSAPATPAGEDDATRELEQADAADHGIDRAALAAARPEPGPVRAATDATTYATRLPPPLTLHYEVRRGAAPPGAAMLSWRVADGRYELRLSGDPVQERALQPPQWASRGVIDAAGIGPERFTVARRGRERHAANLQREAGRITFSGPRLELPLLPGTQDRLSWMLQLAGVLEAEPQRAQAGQQVTMLVVGAHGDAAIWTFTTLGTEAVETPAGTVPGAVHLLREARGAYDPKVEVWLDPQRHHLPVRLRFFVRPTRESTEWRLRALQEP